jgi:uncharacterized protein YbjT (DUF2867 family)
LTDSRQRPGWRAVKPFGGGSGGVGGLAQEAGQELEVLVFVPGADLVHRGVHAGVHQVEAQDFGSAATGRLDDDMRRGEEEIRDSDLDWTIFRPPSLTGKPATGAYRTAIDRNLPHGFTVSRADLAACMLTSLSDPAIVHRHVAIAS